MNDLLIKFLHIVAGLDAQIAVVQVDHMLILHQRLAGAVGADEGGHQLHVEPVVEIVDIQGRAANVDDFLMVLLVLKDVDIGIHRGHILVVQRGGAGQRPFGGLAILQKVAGIQFHQPRVLLLVPGDIAIVPRERGKDILNFVNVHRHARQ